MAHKATPCTMPESYKPWDALSVSTLPSPNQMQLSGTLLKQVRGVLPLASE